MASMPALGLTTSLQAAVTTDLIAAGETRGICGEGQESTDILWSITASHVCPFSHPMPLCYAAFLWGLHLRAVGAARQE